MIGKALSCRYCNTMLISKSIFSANSSSALVATEFLAVFVKGKKMQGISVLPALSASARLYRDSRNADYGCDWKCGMRFATSASRFWPIDLEHAAM
jgi:hypothetical protein